MAMTPRIVGWQLDNEPAVQFDYNLESELAFRDFLRAKSKVDVNMKRCVAQKDTRSCVSVAILSGMRLTIAIFKARIS